MLDYIQRVVTMFVGVVAQMCGVDDGVSQLQDM